MSMPSIYPHGVTIFNPKKTWSGYTLLDTVNDGILMIDMNGNEVRRWKLQSFPAKMLPGGYIMGSSGMRYPDYGMQDEVNLVQIDYDGKIVWKFDHLEYISDPGQTARWMVRQHHDYQREGNPVGYYVPGMEAKTDSGNTLILAHRTIRNPKISDKKLLDDIMIEVDWEGNILWKWSISDHFDELGFDEQALNVLSRNPNMRAPDGGVGDYNHVNCMSYIGPNKWFDQGDKRFKPDNIIFSCREANIIAIIDKESGNLVWKIGPDYNKTAELRALQWIIGQHHAHIIPKGLPGEGNILVFDNGGWAGYGIPNPGAPTGNKYALRDFSRVLEIDPQTLEIVWQATPAELGFPMPINEYKFYSPFISSAQRLPNGNTLIDIGSDGHLIEITSDYEIVWEWICPYYTHDKGPKNNMVYRAYRYPYSYVPQEATPEEHAIEPLDNITYRVPGAAPFGSKKVIEVEGTLPYYPDTALCIASVKESNEMREQTEPDAPVKTSVLAENPSPLSQQSSAQVQNPTTAKKLFTVDTSVFHPLDYSSYLDKILNVKNETKYDLVLFGAERCTHCKALHPILEEVVKEQYPNKFNVYYVDVDKNQDLVKICHIGGIPVVALYKNGQEIKRFNGEKDFDAICDFVDQYAV